MITRTVNILLAACAALLVSACGAGSNGAPNAQPARLLAQSAVVNGSATFNAVRANYSIVKTADGYSVTDNVNGGGTIVIPSGGRLVFTDMSIGYDVAGNAGIVYRLYQAAYNRVPDQVGLGFWIGAMDRNISAQAIAGGFVDSAEFIALYGANPTAEGFVARLYDNVLHRNPDLGGFTFWVAKFKAGVSKADILAAFGESGENVERVNPTIANGIRYLPAISQADAARFLASATFGARMPEIDAMLVSGYGNWIEAQFAKPQTLHRSYMDTLKATLPTGTALTQDNFFESFWTQAIAGDDQLRQRVALALSEIFVVSLQDGTVANYPRGVASYYDVLATNAFGNYRDLLEQVSRHPMMGIYLSSLHNQKESATRVPDENYAREIMQLMSIGLYELNPDGSVRTAGGKALETYGSADISGMAKVFTGWSWAGPDKSANRFLTNNAGADGDWQPMQNYPNYHSISEKKFLGVTIAAQTTAAGEADLAVALERLFAHPNVGPFLGRQLIQRLVTSNPSGQYVGRVAAAFANNGAGVRGDLKAVLKAVLLDPEARTAPKLTDPAIGKLREPILRYGQWLRSFNAVSASGRYRVTNLDDVLSALGQTPMRSPTVFNFFRPGYVPPNSAIATAGLVAPEMQLTAEPSVTGYLNFMRDIIPNGTGISRDLKADYSAELALADQPSKLVDRVALLLMAGQMSDTLRGQVLAAINSVAISATDATAAATAKKNRVYLAVFLTMASSEYLVQK
ncbi:MAG: DUF1800 family protein [Pseudomonadota bacterium]